MGIMAEREQQSNFEIKNSQEIKLPQHLVDEGLEAVETAAQANVKDDGQIQVQPATTGQTTITIPSDQATLTGIAKGSITNAVTWLAAFWLRMIKKAMHFGWKVTRG